MPVAWILPPPPHRSDAPLSLRTGREPTDSGSPRAKLPSHMPPAHVSMPPAPGPWLQPVSPVSVTCPGTPGPALFTSAKSHIPPPGMSQASLRHPAGAAVSGAPALPHRPAFASPPARGRGMAGEGARAAFHPARSCLRRRGRRWRPQLAARKLSLAGLHQARLPSPPPRRHVTAQRRGGGGQSLSKSHPDRSRGS